MKYEFEVANKGKDMYVSCSTQFECNGAILPAKTGGLYYNKTILTDAIKQEFIEHIDREIAKYKQLKLVENLQT